MTLVHPTQPVKIFGIFSPYDTPGMPKIVGGRRPFPAEICVQSDQPPSSSNVVVTSFPYPTVLRSTAGNVPIYMKLAFKVTHPFRKRRFRKLSFKSASAVTAGTDTFCDRNLAQGITPSEGVKMMNYRLRGCIRIESAS